jgi:NhaP-type Na+/H+ or K+/H+ antiporter
MYLDLLWKFLKPVSFSLIGKEVDFSILDGNIVGYGAVALLCGVIGRLVVAYVSAYGANLSWKEKGYVTISGFPKATVQVYEKLSKLSKMSKIFFKTEYFEGGNRTHSSRYGQRVETNRHL